MNESFNDSSSSSSSNGLECGNENNASNATKHTSKHLRSQKHLDIKDNRKHCNKVVKSLIDKERHLNEVWREEENVKKFLSTPLTRDIISDHLEIRSHNYHCGDLISPHQRSMSCDLPAIVESDDDEEEAEVQVSFDNKKNKNKFDSARGRIRRQRMEMHEKAVSMPNVLTTCKY